MEVNVSVAILVGLVVFALLLGVVIRRTQTRVRRIDASRAGSEAGTVTVMPHQLVTAGQSEPDFGERLTVLQFSTDTCARCPHTARTLAAAAEGLAGVRHVEIDVTRRDDLIERFSIMRTPTILVLDGQHRLRTRVSGPVSAAQASELFDEHLNDSTTLERSAA